MKETYAKGLQLFNDHELINMNQEKARKYLNEIDEWLRETKKLLADETGEQSRAEIARKASQDEHFLVELVLELNEKASSSSTNNDLLLYATNSSPSSVDDAKQNSFLKNIEMITSQIKSLGSMFEKRREQLRKSAYPSTGRPVQRVEPQFISHPEHPDGPQSKHSSSSLIKRESMNKVKKYFF